MKQRGEGITFYKSLSSRSALRIARQEKSSSRVSSSFGFDRRTCQMPAAIMGWWRKESDEDDEVGRILRMDRSGFGYGRESGGLLGG
jgi:hypothetical protein